MKRELASWSYQYAPSIHSTRSFLDDVTINEFAIASNNLNSEMIFVLILTTNHWIEIYSAKSLNDEALYSLHLRSPARVHSTINGNFYVLTCNGIVYSIAQQINSDNEFNFNQKTNYQLKISCSMMLSSVLTLNGQESFVVFADNGQSMTICTMERVIYIGVDVSPYISSSSSLKSITSEKTQNLLLLYFNNKTLISCQVKLNESNEKGSLQFTPFDEADKFCLQNNCLATYNNGKTQLNLHDIRSCTCYEPIQLDNECQYLCFNESATYVFALVKPRVLFMYRMTDRRQMAKLFVYDFVLSMVADNDFLVLAMNDRRLLTLMIADPDDPTLQARIQALPSRLESFVVFADNGQSMVICTMERVIYIDVDVSPYISSSSSLKSITSEKTQNLLLLYFNNKTLISCQVKLNESNEKGSLQFTLFDQADKFCLQNNCLATYNNGKTQLNLHDIRSCTCYEPIQLDNECQYLCFNESATYVFALVKPRVLFMYRMTDRRQMAKLFVYDFVLSMVADNDFLVLAMNDRRLLTLMIADPDDPTLQARIQALPSRNLQRLSKSATKRLVDHVEKCGNMSSSDEDESDLDNDNDKTNQQSKKKKNDQANVQKFASPNSLFRIVTRLNERHSLSKMKNDEEIRSQVMIISLDNSETLDMTKMVNNSDDEKYDDNNDVQVPDFVITTDEHKNIDTDLNDIRQKTLEFNKNQIKEIQFANAGDRNLKIVNNHAITSSTCSIT
ncbi:unnamed protein product [Rotaria sp. Silwood2]|nr:unnamed protein product [Rotaria sp. Silwood2]